MKQILLNRTDFKEQVFKRDNHTCLFCDKPAVDAHHIIDRSLWSDGGYYVDNGASLCTEHHLAAEKTLISAHNLRQLAGIDNAIYPQNLSRNEFVVDYDKWGNPILKNGRRLKGYLFYKDNVQKMLKQTIEHGAFDKPFDMLVDKYPRTYHLLNSPGTTSDDRIAKTCNKVLTQGNVITEKLDGENTSMSEYGLFARSRTEPTKNPWAQWLKQRWESIKRDLKDFDLEICGENMYGEHSIVYSGLQEHFYVFGMRNMKHDVFLSWEETEYFAELFDFQMAPVLMKCDGLTYEELVDNIDLFMSQPSELNDSKYWTTPKEGIVIRIKDEFPNDMFYNSVYKYVRAKHVKTGEHWAKNWHRAYLHHELERLQHDKFPQIFEDRVREGLITLS